MAILQKTWGQLLVAAGAILLILVIISALPHLTTASIAMVLLREGLLIVAPVLLLRWLIAAGPVAAGEIGWKPLRPSSFGWALVAGAVSLLAAAGVMLALQALGMHMDNTMAVTLRIAARPAWLLLLIALTAGISEEIVFRAIVLNYLARASGRLWLGAAVSLALFALMHVSGWGWEKVLPAAVPGAVLTGLYLWKRDLGACILAHFFIDAVGLLAAAAALHHG